MWRTGEKVGGIYNTVIVKDIGDRSLRKGKESGIRKVTVKTTTRYLASVVGSAFSVKGITNTEDDYVDVLIESLIFYPAERFDIIGKRHLKTNRKLYMVDLGLRKHILLSRKNHGLGFPSRTSSILNCEEGDIGFRLGKLVLRKWTLSPRRTERSCSIR